MASFVTVNGLAVTHKGCNGVSAATLPDVCKTPSPGGPVPLPYPNVAMSSDLEDGTATVLVDGHSVAIKGSRYARSTGDEPGSAGGVASGTFGKEAKWLLYSFDVMAEGANVCRLTDPLTHNHANSANMGGELHAPAPLTLAEARAVICEAICQCNSEPAQGADGRDLRQVCVSRTLQTLDDSLGNRGTIKPEINYNMTTQPPTPIMSRSNSLRGTEWLPARTGEIPGFRPGTGMIRRPDVVLLRQGGEEPRQENLAAVVEIKFPPDTMDAAQEAAYLRIAGPNPLIVLGPQDCGCPDEEEEEALEPATAPALSPVEVTLLALALVALVADDVVGGEADDVAIPGVLARLAQALKFSPPMAFE